MKTACVPVHTVGKVMQTILPGESMGQSYTPAVQFWQSCHVSLHPSCVTRPSGYLGSAHLSLLLSHQSSVLDVRKFTCQNHWCLQRSCHFEMSPLVKTWWLSIQLFVCSSVQIRQSYVKQQQLIMQVFWQGWDVSLWRFVGRTCSGRSLSAKLKVRCVHA